ncbi:MAG: hypothetical protein JSS07_02410 [Proteobacteria bacterium]|nr:hypothetical protein [Pseudomonadota bacterium]
MKAWTQGMAYMCFGLLSSGCSTMLPYSPTVSYSEYVYYQNCCDDENAQSGYYYNGYQENGWRYCVREIK